MVRGLSSGLTCMSKYFTVGFDKTMVPSTWIGRNSIFGQDGHFGFFPELGRIHARSFIWWFAASPSAVCRDLVQPCSDAIHQVPRIVSDYHMRLSKAPDQEQIRELPPMFRELRIKCDNNKIETKTINDSDMMFYKLIFTSHFILLILHGPLLISHIRYLSMALWTLHRW